MCIMCVSCVYHVAFCRNSAQKMIKYVEELEYNNDNIPGYYGYQFVGVSQDSDSLDLQQMSEYEDY